MFYPDRRLRNADLLASQTQTDAVSFSPVAMEFECYTRFMTALAYDACIQLKDSKSRSGARATASELQEMLNLTHIYDKNLPPESRCRCVSASFLLRVFEEQRRRLEQSGFSRVVSLMPSETSEYKWGKKMEIAPLLAENNRMFSVGDFLKCCAMCTSILEQYVPQNPLLPILKPALTAIYIFKSGRDNDAHGYDPFYVGNLRLLRQWLSSINDPFFGQRSEECSCDLLVPIRRQYYDYSCILMNAFGDADLGAVPRNDLQREGEESDEKYLGCSLYARISTEEWMGYYRLTPFITARPLGDLNDAEYGFLLNTNIGGYYRYRIFKTASAADILVPEEELEQQEETFNGHLQQFNDQFCFMVDNGILPRERNRLRRCIPNAPTQLYHSCHPEFDSFCWRKESPPFVYYKVIDSESEQQLNGLLKKNSPIYSAYLSGHGGLGKTHLVLNLLRTRFCRGLGLAADDVNFKYVVFLSAKQKYIELRPQGENHFGTVSTLTRDYDINDHRSLLEKLCVILFPDDTNLIGRSEEYLETKLIKSYIPILLVIDDLDTMDPVEQKKIDRFVRRYQQKNRRIIVTSRIFSLDFTTNRSNFVPIKLEQLDVKRSVEFADKYASAMGLSQRSEEWHADPEKLFRFTFGVPLNLVLYLNLLGRGMTPGMFEKRMASCMEESTVFMFEHVLANLGEEAQQVFSTLAEYWEHTHTRKLSMSYDLLRLLMVGMDSRLLDAGLQNLVHYELATIQEEGICRTIHLREDISSLKSEGSRPLAVTEEIVRFVKQNPERWAAALEDPQIVLKVFLDISEQWFRSGRDQLQKWSSQLVELLRSTYRDDEITTDERRRLQMLTRKDSMEERQEEFVRLERCWKERCNEGMDVPVEAAKEFFHLYMAFMDGLIDERNCWQTQAEKIKWMFDRCAQYYNKMGYEDAFNDLFEDCGRKLKECCEEYEYCGCNIRSELYQAAMEYWPVF